MKKIIVTYGLLLLAVVLVFSVFAEAAESCNGKQDGYYFKDAGVGTICVKGIGYACSADVYGKVKNVNGKFDALCDDQKWIECDADSEKEGMMAKWPISDVSYKRYNNYFLCGETIVANGPQQQGYTGYETWFVCSASPKPSNSDGVWVTLNSYKQGYQCTTNGWKWVSVDSDKDDIPNILDNCENSPNKDQADYDADGVGDICDVCFKAKNPDQKDSDKDFIGDACDSDDDNDGIADTKDNCPLVSNKDQKNFDDDPYGDACDLDSDKDFDGDGIAGAQDNCYKLPNEDQKDIDGDGVGDVCDNCEMNANKDQKDFDKDKSGDICDNCPWVVNIAQGDNDGDGQGNECDQSPDAAICVVGAQNKDDCVIQFKDANLEKAVKEKLQLGVDEDVTLAKAKSLSGTLILSGKQISDLLGLEFLTNVIGLHLDDNKIMSVASLSYLTGLQKLILRKNAIVDITPLGSLTVLTYLDLGYNNITDISPLNDLTPLSTLYLDGDQITDISVLKSLVNLELLSIANNKLSGSCVSDPPIEGKDNVKAYLKKCLGVTCTPSCAAKQCGDDGCGNSCGTCAAGSSCTAQGQCMVSSAMNFCDIIEGVNIKVGDIKNPASSCAQRANAKGIMQQSAAGKDLVCLGVHYGVPVMKSSSMILYGEKKGISFQGGSEWMTKCPEYYAGTKASWKKITSSKYVPATFDAAAQCIEEGEGKFGELYDGSCVAGISKGEGNYDGEGIVGVDDVAEIKKKPAKFWQYVGNDVNGYIQKMIQHWGK